MSTRTRLLLVLGAVLFVLLAVLVGPRLRQALDPAPLRDFFAGLGALGPVLFTGLLCALLPLGASGHGFVLVAVLVWPPSLAFAVALFAVTAAQLCTFWLYRGSLRRFIAGRIPARLAKYNEAFARRPIRSVFLLRVITFTWQPGSMALSVAPVRTMQVAIGTVLGTIPGVAMDVLVGESLVAWLKA
jgi:uncharacterized membrane protein YdjX (TVP38/TMEM64 family)